MTERALSFCKFPDQSLILDIGCGTGVTLSRLASVYRLQAVGIDSSSLLLAAAHSKNPSLRLLKGLGERLPFPRDCFDGVILECALSLIDDSAEALAECYRVLRSNGSMIISDVFARNPSSVSALRELSLNSCLRGAFNLNDLEDGLIKAGFEIEFLEDHSDLLKSFASQIVWHYGSMANFWIRGGCRHEELEKAETAISNCRPGYFLLVARKSAAKQKARS